jgi:hypothetical protein
MKKITILSILVLCGLMISPKSSMAVTVDDLFISTNLPDVGGGFIGGDGDLGDPEGLDWMMGNCVPFEYTTTSDLVISTCDGDYMDPGSWKEVMRITKEGNVGIGTTEPDHKLVVGHAGGGRHLVINDIPTARWGFSTGNYALSIQNDWGGSWTTRMIIDNTGNVGIGTTHPEEKLDIKSNNKTGYVGARLQIPGNSTIDIRTYGDKSSAWAGSGILTTWNTDVDLGLVADSKANVDNGTSHHVIWLKATSGNVGIGTTNPSEKLEVEGNVKAWGYITGDITFQKDGKALWRMFEDEKGLYLENISTGKVYRFVLEEVK